MIGPRAVTNLVLTLMTLMVVAGAAAQSTVGPPAGYATAFRPGYTIRDLPDLTETLRLTEDQVIVAEEVLHQYTQAFTKRSLEVRREISQLRGAMQPDPREQAASARMTEQIRTLRDKSRADAAATDDPLERRRILEQFQEDVEMLRAARGPRGDFSAAYTEMVRKVEARLGVWATERDGMDRALERDFQAVLTTEQRERWPVYERHRRRERMLPSGTLGGEASDLVAHVATLPLSAADRAAIEPLIETYAAALDAALVMRAGVVPDAERARDEALAEQDYARALAEFDRAMQAHITVRDVNEQFRSAIAGALPSAHTRVFLAAVDRKAFPRIHRPSVAARVLETAAQRATDPEVKQAIEALEANRSAAWTAATLALRPIALASQPKGLRGRYERLRERAEGRPAAPRPDPLAAAMEQRDRADIEVLGALRTLIGDDAFMRLPGAEALLSGPATRDVPTLGPPDPAGPTGRELIQKYDRNGDGFLSPGETEEMRRALRQGKNVGDGK